MKSSFEIADKIIAEAYSDFYNKGLGWWGTRRIPNYGILRGAITKALYLAQTKDNLCPLGDGNVGTASKAKLTLFTQEAK